MAGKVRCYSTFRLHSEHVQGWCASSGSIPYVESGASTHAEVNGQLRQFPVPEPGRAWLGPQWPHREAGFGSQCITFGSSPNPSPWAYKRQSAEPFTLFSSLPALLLHCLLSIALSSLLSVASSSLPPLRWLFSRCLIIGVRLPGRASS